MEIGRNRGGEKREGEKESKTCAINSQSPLHLLRTVDLVSSRSIVKAMNCQIFETRQKTYIPKIH